MNPLAPIIPWIDLFGIAVFAASGALAAAQRKQTLVTFVFFALVTGVGGGTVRDLLIDAPVFWVRDWRVAAVCLSTALLIWVTPQRWWSERALDWFDAVGLAAYAVFGAAKMGVITASVGGSSREVLAGAPSILLRPELYVTAAALAAGLFVLLLWAGLGAGIAAPIAALTGFGLRALAILRGLKLPAYRR